MPSSQSLPDSDPFELQRFVRAQERDYTRALTEIRAGHKVTHWMWYIFPQFQGLGASPMSQRYAIRSLAEARAYLAHPVLGPRLRECAEAVLLHQDRSATEIFSPPDDLKLRSCATLFARASDADAPFKRLLAQFYDGQEDEATLRCLQWADSCEP